MATAYFDSLRAACVHVVLTHPANDQVWLTVWVYRGMMKGIVEIDVTKPLGAVWNREGHTISCRVYLCPFIGIHDDLDVNIAKICQDADKCQVSARKSATRFCFRKTG